MRNPLIAGNWKMYKTTEEAVSFATCSGSSPARPSISWALTIACSCPASLSSRPSPTHIIGVMSVSKSLCSFLFTVSFVSAKYCLLSE